MAGTNNLFIWFIDVGMGDATFVKFPDGTTMLVDFGSTKASQITDDILEFFTTLKQEGFLTQTLFKIDYLFITHSDQDHYNLLKHLIARDYTFGNIFFSGQASEYSAGGPITKKSTNEKWKNCAAWLQAQQVKQDPVTNKPIAQKLISNGHKSWKTCGGAIINILASNVVGKGTAGMINNTKSIVLMIEYGGTKVVLSADATYLTEKAILHQVNDPKGNLNGLNLNNAILKLGHHGSARTSTSKEWVEALQPICLFVSAERFGEQAGTKGKATGHRLPQQAAIDTVLQFSPNTLRTTAGNLAVAGGAATVTNHSYVAYHDDTSKKEYFGTSRELDNFLKTTGSKLTDQTITTTQDQGKVSNYYYEVKTDKQIFTTICKLDFPD